MMNLKVLVQRARAEGWAAAEGHISGVPYQLSLFGWSLIPSRKGGPLTDVLTPQTPPEAPKRSLSAQFGLAEQPLHTDGAHHPVPPDVLLFSVDEPSHVPTLLWRMPRTGLDPKVMQDLRHGLFTVRSGNETFLAPVLDGDRVRYDPGCMSPSDSRSRRAADLLDSRGGEAVPHQWTTAGVILAVDNRRVLHARAAAHDDQNRSMNRWAIRVPEGTA